MIVPPRLRAITSPHRAALEAAFGPIRPEPGRAMPPQNMLFLGFTNRCGSNYLAQLLASTGAFNEAGEFFNAATVLEHAARLGLRSLAAYVAALPQLVPARPNLAAKAGPDQLFMLADAGVPQALGGRAFYLLLERQNRLAQAISRVIATQNSRWTTSHSPTRPDSALVYDRAAIDLQLQMISDGNAAFYVLFAANGIVPVHVTYEAMMQNPQSVVDAVSQRMGLGKLKIRPPAITIKRQANEINASWEQRYKSGE
jgi:trehalose 2-sulfotransferase